MEQSSSPKTKQQEKERTEENGKLRVGYNLTFSLLLKPNCKINEIENLTIEIAETIVNTVKQLYDINLEIKYPNDVILNKKKLRRNTYRKFF